MIKTWALLSAFTFLLLPVGCQANDASERLETAREEVARLGGTVEVYNGHIQSISLEGCNLSSADWDKILPLKGVIWLQLNGSNVNDEALRHLEGCVNLENLELGHTDVTDVGLGALDNLPRLNRLWLRGCQVSDKGVETLKSIDELEVVVLIDTFVTTEGIERLKSDSQIESILWSTVQSKEVSRSMTALAQGGAHVSSTSEFARKENEYPILYRVRLTPQTKLPATKIEKPINILATAGDLSLTLEGHRYMPLLPKIKRIKDVYIQASEEGSPFDSTALKNLESVQAEEVYLVVPKLSPEILTTATKVNGLRRLNLDDQVISPQVWQAIVQTPELETIGLYNCEFKGIEQFIHAPRQLTVTFSGADTAPEDERKRIEELALPVK
ncbi:hypothetical protein DTL42_01020 [Bremerella cremea]|uniref:Leucine Rich repeats (2 copies) n=1 Tax=Bremerella cremea TaxID=1031537 RepID=A0A368KXD8_9BACT|nr:hypothetical protein [Bremerella cremea]RCS56000.1 hypothetical protein DTL42_01020 [Bremerella cremea]